MNQAKIIIYLNMIFYIFYVFFNRFIFLTLASKKYINQDMAANYQLKQVARITGMGHMQAVSEDGNIVIYRTEDYFYVYYFDGYDVQEKKFQPRMYLQQITEKYNEEAKVWNLIYTRVWENLIVVYALGYSEKEICRAKISLEKNGESEMEEKELDSIVLDMALHPFQDCLVVLTYNSLNFIFQGKNQPDYQFKLPSTSSAMGGKIMMAPEGPDLYIYVIMIRKEGDTETREYYKIRQESFGNSYQLFLSTIDNINYSLYYDRFQVFDYDPDTEIFGMVRDHLNRDSTYREYTQFFITTDFVFLELSMENDNRIFHSFLPGNKMLYGNFKNFPGAEKFHLAQICLVPFSIVQDALIIHSEEHSCKKGYFDRVAVWRAHNQTYILTQIDYYLTISQGDFNDELPLTVPANTFSTRMDDYLIIDNFGHLQYFQWSPKIQSPKEPRQQNTSADGYIIAMVILIVCVLVLTVGLGWTFFKLRQLNGHRQEAQPKHHEYRNQEKNDDKNPFVREPRKRNKTPPKKNNFDPFSTEKQLRFE